MEKIREYFEACKNYWLRNGDTEKIARLKAFWWDCVEIWSVGNSWTPEKERFARKCVGYVPDMHIPSEEEVKSGNAPDFINL